MNDTVGSPSDQVEAQATEVVKGGFLQSLVDIIIDPVSVFRRIERGLTWWKPYIVIAVIMLVLGFLAMPIQRAAMSLSMSSADEEQVAQALERMEQFAWLQPVGGAVWALIVILISAVVAHILITLISSQSNIKKTLSLIVYCRLIVVLGDIVKFVVLKMRGFENIESLADLRVNLSLAAFFPDIGSFGWAFLDSFGLFQVWYYILLVIGISIVFKASRKIAIVPVVPIWAGYLLWQFITTMLSGRAG